MKKAFFGFSIGVFVTLILLIIFLASDLWKRFFIPKTAEHQGTIYVTPQHTSSFFNTGRIEQVSWDESLSTKVPLEEGEIKIAVLNRESKDGIAEEQFVAYINSVNTERRVYITYIIYDERTRRYRRLWDAPTAATRPEILSLFSQDLIGDRNNCIIVTGMNNRNEHTMTVFRKNPSLAGDQAFDKILELQIDGSIIIQETGRSLAYQQGVTTGQSFNIAAYGHDNLSSNILDQIEFIYSYNPSVGQYEQTSISRIPGSQIEQRRLQEILSGERGVFENFINDLWYYVSPQGTIDSRQYLYFDPSAREIIFYGNESQQVFHWLNSTPTRYGLNITSQNISISTLRRRIDIELESLDSIRLRVSEDVRIKIEVIESWDGSYRRAGAISARETVPSIKPAFNMLYDSSWGRIQFHNTGEYTITSGSTTNSVARKGRYIFYTVDGQELLELRPEDTNDFSENNRMVYKTDNLSGNTVIILSRVRVGTTGIQDLFEPPVTLTLAE